MGPTQFPSPPLSLLVPQTLLFCSHPLWNTSTFSSCNIESSTPPQKGSGFGYHLIRSPLTLFLDRNSGTVTYRLNPSSKALRNYLSFGLVSLAKLGSLVAILSTNFGNFSTGSVGITLGAIGVGLRDGDIASPRSNSAL